MITEEEIIEILNDYFKYGRSKNFDLTYGKSIWIDNKDLQNIAKIIMDKIKEEEMGQETLSPEMERELRRSYRLRKDKI